MQMITCKRKEDKKDKKNAKIKRGERIFHNGLKSEPFLTVKEGENEEVSGQKISLAPWKKGNDFCKSYNRTSAHSH